MRQQDEAAMRAALERHDAVLRAAIEAQSGYVFSTGGDGFGATFARAADAVSVRGAGAVLSAAAAGTRSFRVPSPR